MHTVKRSSVQKTVKGQAAAVRTFLHAEAADHVTITVMNWNSNTNTTVHLTVQAKQAATVSPEWTVQAVHAMKITVLRPADLSFPHVQEDMNVWRMSIRQVSRPVSILPDLI